MALVTRARAAGILSLCLLLVSSLGATGALASAAPPETAAPQVAAIVIGTGSCVGTDACTGAVGPIGDNSCNGTEACRDTTGSIGNNSCNGTSIPCRNSSADIGDNSCQDSFACTVGPAGLSHDIGDNSCHGTSACEGATGNIGDNSCYGSSACTTTANIGANSCHGSLACLSADDSIGNGSCNGSHACLNAQSTVGNYSCNGSDICTDAADSIGDCANNAVSSVPPICEVQPDARIRRSGGELWGNNIYNETGADQYVSLKIYAGDKRIVYISIQNDSPVATAFGFCPCNEIGDPTGITIRYFHGNNELVGKLHTPTVQPGEKYVIRARVAVDSTAVPGQLYARLVSISAPYSPNRDTVAIWVQRK